MSLGNVTPSSDVNPADVQFSMRRCPSTVRYLGVEVDDDLDIAERIHV